MVATNIAGASYPKKGRRHFLGEEEELE